MRRAVARVDWATLLALALLAAVLYALGREPLRDPTGAHAGPPKRYTDLEKNTIFK